MIIFVAVFAFWGLSSLILPSFIKHKINEGNFGNYQFEIEKVRVNLPGSRIVLDSFHAKSNIDGMDVLVPKLKITGVKIIRLLLKRSFVANAVYLHSPQVLLEHGNYSANGVRPYTSKQASAEFFVGNFVITNGNFEFINTNDTSRFSRIEIEFINLSLNRDEQYVFKNFSFDHLSGNIEEWSVPLSNNLYTVVGCELEFGTSKNIQIGQLHLSTNYPKYEVGHKTGVETDWFDFDLQDIKISGFEMQKLLENRGFIANNVSLGKVKGFAFRDKRLPRGNKPDTKLPMQALDELKLPLQIDSLSFENAYIKYEEHAVGADEAGTVFFSGLSAKAYQISNIRKLILLPTTISVSGKLMGKAHMDAYFVIPNKKYPGEYEVKGKLEPTAFGIINPIVNENLAADIKSGYIHELNFDFHYNNDLSEGALTIQYSDLKIDLLNRRNDSAKPVQSVFFNGLILKKDNLKNKKVYREGTIHFSRDKKKSLFNYWWKSLYSGIKSVAVPKPLL